MHIRALVFPALALISLAAGTPSEKAPSKAKASADSAPAVPAPQKGMKRFMVVRTFPAGALDGLDAAAKKSVNACNFKHGVKWVHSYANADKTKTFCIYDGPNEQAIRDAATDNKIPVDAIVEIPVVLRPR